MEPTEDAATPAQVSGGALWGSSSTGVCVCTRARSGACSARVAVQMKSLGPSPDSQVLWGAGLKTGTWGLDPMTYRHPCSVL